MEVPSLPQDALILLFSFVHSTELLSSMSLVCKKWNQACNSDLLWKERAIRYSSSVRDVVNKHGNKLVQQPGMWKWLYVKYLLRRMRPSYNGSAKTIETACTNLMEAAHRLNGLQSIEENEHCPQILDGIKDAVEKLLKTIPSAPTPQYYRMSRLDFTLDDEHENDEFRFLKDGVLDANERSEDKTDMQERTESSEVNTECILLSKVLDEKGIPTVITIKYRACIVEKYFESDDGYVNSYTSLCEYNASMEYRVGSWKTPANTKRVTDVFSDWIQVRSGKGKVKRIGRDMWKAVQGMKQLRADLGLTMKLSSLWRFLGEV